MGCTRPEQLDASEMAQLLATGELRAEELVGAHLDRIERSDSRLGAFVDVYAFDALEAARAADRARSARHAAGAFHGVPIALKDIIDLEGRVTRGGSKLWSERVSPLTASLASRLFEQGLCVLGKTHTVEFAMGSWGTNQHLGTPWNPWDLAEHRAPGGSSSGSAVAVAARLSPWAIGTDTGGSVRIPASWNGLTGLKTTLGRISCHGVLPLAPTLDTPGPICRSARDAALLYRLLAGPDPNDASTLRRSVADPLPELDLGVQGLALGRLPDVEREGVDTEVLAAYDEALAVLESRGARIVELSLPLRFSRLGELVGQIIGVEGYSLVGALVDDQSLPLDDDVRPRIQLGRSIAGSAYLQLLRQREQDKQAFADAVRGVHALLTPTTATTAPRVSEIDQSGTAAWFTRPFNYLDWCALAVPNGITTKGLPTSLQIACRGFDEATALRIGHAFQEATEWHHKRPPEG